MTEREKALRAGRRELIQFGHSTLYFYWEPYYDQPLKGDGSIKQAFTIDYSSFRWREPDFDKAVIRIAKLERELARAAAMRALGITTPIVEEDIEIVAGMITSEILPEE